MYHILQPAARLQAVGCLSKRTRAHSSGSIDGLQLSAPCGEYGYPPQCGIIAPSTDLIGGERIMLRIALAQINAIVGNLTGNVNKILAHLDRRANSTST